jgi:8-oxo-dGTP pyrophosphatase MutT (NUDIX family)
LGESPLEACRRELVEEISLDLKIERLLVVDYKSETGQSSESLQFIFYGGVLDDLLIKKITLPPDELEGYKFIKPDDIDKYFSESLGKRIKHSYEALKSNSSVYLENHERIDVI